MLSRSDTKILKRMEDTWFAFKLSRNSKPNSNELPQPWLSMLERESYIDELFRIMKRCKRKVEVYE
jgi:hypothetical protein